MTHAGPLCIGGRLVQLEVGAFSGDKDILGFRGGPGRDGESGEGERHAPPGLSFYVLVFVLSR